MASSLLKQIGDQEIDQLRTKWTSRKEASRKDARPRESDGSGCSIEG
jgi:hypothetical protein